MGDYARIEVLLAESDFNPEEREFMARLEDRYFGPARLLRDQPDSFREQAALRDQVHADLRLPGLPKDWDYIGTEEVDGRRYYQPPGSLPTALIPPFPRRFADVYELREKYGIQPIWYAMFSPADRRDDRLRFLTTIAEARKRFAANFDGVWGLLFAGNDDRTMEALMGAAQEGSEGRRCLERIFDRFPFASYLSVLRFLAVDWGGNALIELNYCEIVYSYGGAEENEATIRAEFESTTRVLDAIRRHDLASLPGEAFFDSNRAYGGSGVFPWLAPYEHHEAIRRFRRWLIPDFYE